MIQLIVNPTAGRGIARQYAGSVGEYLRGRGKQVSVFVTKVRHDAEHFVRSLLSQPDHGGCEALCVCGGDGTINEVINGMGDAGSVVPLALLPAGTANCLAGELDLPNSPEETAAIIIGGRTRMIDVGIARFGDNVERRFILAMGAGLDAEVLRRLEQRRSGNITVLAYAVPIVQAMLRFPLVPLDVQLEKADATLEVHSLIVAHLKRYGYFRLFAQTWLDDGLLETVPLRSGTRLGFFLRAALRLFKTEEPVRDFGFVITKKRADDPPVPVQLDGEFVGWLPVTVGVLRQSLKIMIPK